MRCLFSLALGVAAAGCATISGLDQLEVERDSGDQGDGSDQGDGGTQNDGSHRDADSASRDSRADSRMGDDSSSTCPSQPCTGAAHGCSDQCQSDYDACKAQFCGDGGSADGGSCAMCFATRDTCQNACISTCKSCQYKVACVDTGQCAMAVHN